MKAFIFEDKSKSISGGTFIAYEKAGVHYALSSGTPIFFNDLAGLTIEDWIKKNFKTNEILSKNIEPGIYFKRIWKPGLANSRPPYGEVDSREKFLQSSLSINILLQKLFDIFEVIDPTHNLQVYGYKIRELFLLACMEVESSLSAVLSENEYKKVGRLDTTDYIHLSEPMLLGHYAVSLRAYPKYHIFKPFSDWDKSFQTKSLIWYHCYHKTKHDREKYLYLATLQNTIDAVAAAVILHRAQFGKMNKYYGQSKGVDDKIDEIFDFNDSNIHSQVADLYVPEVILTNENGKKVAVPSCEWVNNLYKFNQK